MGRSISLKPKDPERVRRGRSNRRRGVAFEYRVKAYYLKVGWPEILRSAGSHGVADLVAMRDGGAFPLDVSVVAFISCRTNGLWTKQEVRDLYDRATRINAQAHLVWRDNDDPRARILTEYAGTWLARRENASA